MNKHILYLAAGNSRRLGENKLLMNLHGKPLYRHGFDMLLEFSEGRNDCTFTVVTQYPQIFQEVTSLGVAVVYNPESRLGLSHTIRAGIQSLVHLRKDDFLLFVVADQPYLQSDTIERLLAYAQPNTRIARLFWGDIPGNPVLFSAAFVPKLLALQGDDGGREIIRKYGCVPVQISNAKEFMDIDTPDDLKKISAADCFGMRISRVQC